MVKSTLKRSASKRAGKPALQIAFHRPSAAEIRRATEEAIKVARTKTDEDIDRAIKNDPDTFEADINRLVLVRPEDADVARIRSGLGLTQAGFAAATGIPHRLISDWEQGRKKPSAAARAFLVLIDEFGEKALKRLARRAAA
jgi:DNA-binding transcriptional regulator YiaG